MLLKELKDLDENKLISRKVHDAFPPIVEYTATKHTETFHCVIYALREWDYLHRNKLSANNNSPF